MIAAFLLSSAVAYDPMPPYPDCTTDRRDLCPSEVAGSWELHSWIPDGSLTTVRPEELALGSGIAADVAFREATGDWATVVAVLDSGIYWQDASIAAKVRLNAGELPDPIGADGLPSADPDGNGHLDIADWQWDLSIDWTAGADPADDVLDPSDLIARFSDGIDDDGNGFPDDIAGWDFFDLDNDPYAALQVGEAAEHGTGVMEGAAAGGDDGGDVGTCPNCAIVPIRIGDSFVVSGDRVGMGLVYAATVPVDAAAMAIGAMSHPAHTRAAIRYAWDNGIVLVGAAGDEMSYHHNFPAAEDPIIYVHSIRGDNQNEDEETFSYFNTWNCNNVGPRVDLVAPSNACATGAVAMIAGSAALLRATGRQHDLELDSNEIRALLTTTTDEVVLSEADAELAKTWPTAPGWDPFSGYGRVHLGRAVQAVSSGNIPPIADISSPRWFSHVNGVVQVEGTIGAPHDSVSAWVLERGDGQQPDLWTEVASGDSAVDGLLATVDLPAQRHALVDLSDQTVLERFERAHEALVQLRLTVTDGAGRTASKQVGVWTHDDPDLFPGFPIDLGTSVEGGASLVDLNDDGVFEIVVVGSDGTVHAFRSDGSEMPGFPVTTDPWPGLGAVANAEPWASGGVPFPNEGVLAGPAVGDLDGDGAADIVVGTAGGHVHAWRNDGSPVPGFPVAIVGRTPEEFTPGNGWENGIFGAPALVDVDGDGDHEIIVAAMDQRLYVWDGDGALLPGWPLDLCTGDGCSVGARIVAVPAVADIDGDGDPDAVLGTNEIPPGATGQIYAVDLRSVTVLPGFPMFRPGLINQSILPMIGEGHPSSVGLIDLDGDGRSEIVSEAMLGADGVVDLQGNEVLDLRFTGDAFGVDSNVHDPSIVTLASNPAIGDLDGDGTPDIVYGGSGVNWLVALPLALLYEHEHGVLAWSGKTAEVFPGFPRQIDDVSFFVGPAIADISGDGRPEVITTSGGHFMYAWNVDGQIAPGWPKFTGGWSVSGPSVGDVSGDGYLDVVLTTREGYLFAWSTLGDASANTHWPSPRHDPQNTGSWHSPLVAQAGPVPQATGPTGCCRKDSSAAGLLWLPGLFTLFWRRRCC